MVCVNYFSCRKLEGHSTYFIVLDELSGFNEEALLKVL
jgi:hypothetical protein